MALFTADELRDLTGSTVTEERYAAIHANAIRLLRTVYRPDPELAVGRVRDVLAAVALSVAMRLLSNPTGARSLGLGSANVTFGGADADITSPGTLTHGEAAMLRALKRRPASSVPLLAPQEDTE